MPSPLSVDDYLDASEPLAAKVRALVELTAEDVPPSVELKTRVMDTVVGYALAYTGATSAAELRQLCQLFRRQERRMIDESLARQQKHVRAGRNPAEAMHVAQQELAAVADRILMNELIAFPRIEDVYRRCADPRSDPSKGYATRMLLDVRATAALFTEIALTRFDPRVAGGGRGTSLDLGSGSGVLTLALAVAALRNGVPVEIHAHELAPHHVRLSAEVLGALPLAPEVSFEVHATDLTRPGALGRVLEGVHGGEAPLRHWISETFGHGTPAFVLQEDSIRWSPRSSIGGSVGQRQLDPIQDILLQTCKHDPGFLERVRAGEVRMFPDVTDDSFRPDELESTIRLKRFGEAFVPLQRVGECFAEFEDFGMRDRWEDPAAAGGSLARAGAKRAKKASRGGASGRPRKKRR